MSPFFWAAAHMCTNYYKPNPMVDKPFFPQGGGGRFFTWMGIFGVTFFPACDMIDKK